MQAYIPDSDIPPPPGVTLRDPTDYRGRREDLYNNFKSAMVETFPQTYGGVSVHLENVDYEGDVDDSPDAEKSHILSGGDMFRKLRGDLILKDATSGVDLERKRMTLAKVPHLSNRGTFILGGNDYTVLSQDRLRPGTYVRRKKNGQLEAQVNSLMGTGPSVRVSMDPDTPVYYLEKQTSRWRLYPILRALGYEDSDLRARWGDHVWEANRNKSNDKAFEAAYTKLVRNADPNATQEQKVAKLREVLDSIKLHKDVVAKTLPNLLQTKVASEWRKEAAKLDTMKFSPDFTFDQMVKSRNMILGHHGPLLGGSRSWPDKWKTEDGKGWMEWYEGWCAGKRTVSDTHNIRRWKAMVSRTVPLLRKTLSPRWAAVLEHWAVDPRKVIPATKLDAFDVAMKRHHDESTKAHWSGSGIKMAAVGNVVEVAMLVAEHLGDEFDPREGREKAAAYLEDLDAAGYDMERVVEDATGTKLAEHKPLPMLDPKMLKLTPAPTHAPTPVTNPAPKPASGAVSYKDDPSYQWYADHVRTQEARDAVAKGYKFQDKDKRWHWKWYKDPAGLDVSGYGTRIRVMPPPAGVTPAPHEIWVPRGTDLNKWTMPDARAEELLHQAIHNKMGVAQRNYESIHGAGKFDQLPMFARAALAEGPYMGEPSTPKAYAAAAAGKWEDMGKELLFNYTDPASKKRIPITARNEALLEGLRQQAAKLPLAQPVPVK